MGIWVASFLAMMHNVSMDINLRFSCGHSFHFFEYKPESGIVDLYDKLMFNFLRNCPTVFQVDVPYYIFTRNVWGFLFLHILTNICESHFYYRHSCRYKVVSNGLNLHFPNDKGNWALFMCLLAISHTCCCGLCIFHLTSPVNTPCKFISISSLSISPAFHGV